MSGPRKISAVAFVALAFAACGGGAQPARSGADPVSYGEWCRLVCERTASHAESACSAPLLDPGLCTSSCDQGRGDKLSARTYDEANACTGYIDSLGCEQLGFAIGQMAMGAGEYAERCTAR
ncbi:MAG: hypothetical protein U0271_38375 [Polyangiaceae bacterium]